MNNDKFYVYGGISDEKQINSEIFQFDLKTKIWSQLFISGISNPICKHSAVVLTCDQQIRALKKENDENYLQNELLMNFDKNKQKEEEMNFNQKVFFFGGKSEKGHSLGQMMLLESNEEVWSLNIIFTKNKGPISRYGCGICYLMQLNSIAVYGGVHVEDQKSQSKRILNDFYVLNVKNLIWTQIASDEMLPALKYLSISEFGKGDICLFGGKNVKNSLAEGIFLLKLVPSKLLNSKEKFVLFE